jgi:hypothetical protein
VSADLSGWVILILLGECNRPRIVDPRPPLSLIESDGVRGSDPKNARSRCALNYSGLPDPRLDRFAVTSSSPSQFCGTDSPFRSLARRSPWLGRLLPVPSPPRSYRGNMHSGRLLSGVAFTDDHVMAHRCRGAGRPPHQELRAGRKCCGKKARFTLIKITQECALAIVAGNQ